MNDRLSIGQGLHLSDASPQSIQEKKSIIKVEEWGHNRNIQWTPNQCKSFEDQMKELYKQNK